MLLAERVEAILDAHNEHDFNQLMTFLTDVGKVLARSQRDVLNAPGPEQVGSEPAPGRRDQRTRGAARQIALCK